MEELNAHGRRRMDLQCGKGLGGNGGQFDVVRDENENKD